MLILGGFWGGWVFWGLFCFLGGLGRVVLGGGGFGGVGFGGFLLFGGGFFWGGCFCLGFGGFGFFVLFLVFVYFLLIEDIGVEINKRPHV